MEKQPSNGGINYVIYNIFISIKRLLYSYTLLYSYYIVTIQLLYTYYIVTIKLNHVTRCLA